MAPGLPFSTTALRRTVDRVAYSFGTIFRTLPLPSIIRNVFARIIFTLSASSPNMPACIERWLNGIQDCDITTYHTEVVDMGRMDIPSLPIDGDYARWFDANFRYDEYGGTKAKWPEVRALVLAAQSIDNPAKPPVAFPTETVYGLGADATSSEAVQRIYKAKNRPSDNPLIVHIASLEQLRPLMRGEIPEIYVPLIQRFWPGPLTILLPLPHKSPFAPEVHGDRNTIGVRMPATPLARLLIALANKPIAAPSANTSGKPSPTEAQHVKHDLKGRIQYILDGGPCQVGLESTVVDGLSDPPAILRPGGISIEQIRAVGGKWADTVVGYEDKSLPHSTDGAIQAPRAPGMKYPHYSPEGKVLLFEAGQGMKEKMLLDAQLQLLDLLNSKDPTRIIGIITTESWPTYLSVKYKADATWGFASRGPSPIYPEASMPQARDRIPDGRLYIPSITTADEADRTRVIYSCALGGAAHIVARDIFAALRELDRRKCDTIFVEGISEQSGELAAAVMNRLRKAAEDQGTVEKDNPIDGLVD